MDKSYDITMIGPVAHDITQFEGTEERSLGGAVFFSSAAAARSGAQVLVVTKCSEQDRIQDSQMEQPGVSVQIIDSRCTTSAVNAYHSADREKRTITLVSRSDAFAVHEIPSVETRIIHIAGLFAGDCPDTLIEAADQVADVALDVQGVLRAATASGIVFRDWALKERYLPHIRYLKADAAEAEIMSGTSNREHAGRMFCEMGADEVMITRSDEVMLVHAGKTHRAPLRPNNLSGRTGRGDTCFAAYLARRQSHSIQESLDYAAALVSMKMESPGAFHGTMGDVERRMMSAE